MSIGVDIGKTQDPTAVCIAETQSRRVDGRAVTHYLIRHLNRLPLGTVYPSIVERIDDIATPPPREGHRTL